MKLVWPIKKFLTEPKIYGESCSLLIAYDDCKRCRRVVIYV